MSIPEKPADDNIPPSAANSEEFDISRDDSPKDDDVHDQDLDVFQKWFDNSSNDFPSIDATTLSDPQRMAEFLHN